ncbi:hypothetical protein K435DRAFT_669403 [Dendrothele bispora CBS 962.96]|uniref:C2H2-type domain-containing protein n=1 Tax=Dendrothele bispora (strain CBS 962.96) TaxID=1314807 RepID=A0A4S8LWM5_DENBC|nr:hypothetical protein K435DRAFT_669403 [Dendrothele bispora CBS 962.96]
MSTKRPRLPSISSSESVSTQSPTPKASRIVLQDGSSATTHSLLCSLPPTCNHNPTPIANTKDLEIHYANYHAHVCEEPGCRCVFPEAKLLELHQTECHDPLVAVRKERGEKIFGCFLSTCNKKFLTPKARRLHLIQGHHYPKEYFFAVTNKGVGGLLKKWGEGASMIRGEWKKREEPENEDSNDEEATNDDGKEAYNGTGHEDVQLDLEQDTTNKDTLDNLADSMSSLSLVPSAVRFGRGGKKTGFAHNDTHASEGSAPSQGRGRGGRNGRGQGLGLVNGVGISNEQGHNNVDIGGAVPGSRPVHARGIYRGRVGVNMTRGIRNVRGKGRGNQRG